MPPCPLEPRKSPKQAINLEREFHAQPSLRRRLIAAHLAVGWVGIDGVAVRVLGDILDLFKPDGPTWATDVQPVERRPGADSPGELEEIGEPEIQVPDGGRPTR